MRTVINDSANELKVNYTGNAIHEVWQDFGAAAQEKAYALIGKDAGQNIPENDSVTITGSVDLDV